MNLIEIDDIKDSRLEIYRHLRDKAFIVDSSFIADSPKVVNILLNTQIIVKSILATREYYKQNQELIVNKNIAKLFVASKKQLETIVGHKVHHNVMMHAVRPLEEALTRLDNSIVMLDEITSTENIGSIARSAAALEVDSYLLPKQGPHPYSRRAVRVSMGHISKLKFHLYDNIITTIETLKSNGYTIFAAETDTRAIPLNNVIVPKKWVLLFGHEGKGLSSEVLATCDQVVKIKMVNEVKSLNVGVAASIIIHHFKNI